MERALHARDQIGVEDFVLLEDYQSQDAFVDNLRKRFKADLIYVSEDVTMETEVLEMSFLVMLFIDGCSWQCSSPYSLEAGLF